MDTTSGARLVRHVVATVVLAAAAVVVAWQVVFTAPGMGVAGIRRVGFPGPPLWGQPCRQDACLS
jgi:hypothetical protein